MQAASALANKLPWKPYRGPQREARLSHCPAETTADAVREAKPKHTQGCWPAAGSHTRLRVAGSHHAGAAEQGEEGWTWPRQALGPQPEVGSGLAHQ